MAGLRWFIYQTSEETISERACPRRWRGLNKTPSMQIVFIGWDK